MLWISCTGVWLPRQDGHFDVLISISSPRIFWFAFRPTRIPTLILWVGGKLLISEWQTLSSLLSERTLCQRDIRTAKALRPAIFFENCLSNHLSGEPGLFSHQMFSQRKPPR